MFRSNAFECAHGRRTSGLDHFSNGRVRGTVGRDYSRYMGESDALRPGCRPTSDYLFQDKVKEHCCVNCGVKVVRPHNDEMDLLANATLSGACGRDSVVSGISDDSAASTVSTQDGAMNGYQLSCLEYMNVALDRTQRFVVALRRLGVVVPDGIITKILDGYQLMVDKSQGGDLKLTGSVSDAFEVADSAVPLPVVDYDGKSARSVDESAVRRKRRHRFRTKCDDIVDTKGCCYLLLIKRDYRIAIHRRYGADPTVRSLLSIDRKVWSVSSFSKYRMSEVLQGIYHVHAAPVGPTCLQVFQGLLDKHRSIGQPLRSLIGVSHRELLPDLDAVVGREMRYGDSLQSVRRGSSQVISEVGTSLSYTSIIAIVEGIVLFVVIVLWWYNHRGGGKSRGGGGSRQGGGQGQWYR